MSSERETCGLGSIIPMSCRGRAEAFARRLQSRLQTLGRSGTGLDESADESSWIGRQSSVTSCQPRLSSSSDSDIFFDFDLDAPGSPEEEVPPDAAVASDQLALDVDSGSVLSLATTDRTSPVSEESSDERYFDPETSDCDSSRSEVLSECKPKHAAPVSGDGDKTSNFAALCNGHIGAPYSEYSNLRKNDGCSPNDSYVIGRCNKINKSKFENLHIDGKTRDCINCYIPDSLGDCVTQDSPTDQKQVKLVPDSGDREAESIFPEESINETDDHLQSTWPPESTAAVTEIDNDYNSVADLVKYNLCGTDVCTLSDEPVCSCRESSPENPCSKSDGPCENAASILTTSSENVAVSQNQNDHGGGESPLHICSAFNRPKNLLIDCAILSSGIEQLPALVPLKIDLAQNNVPQEAAETESDLDVDVECQKHTDDEACDDNDDEERPRRVQRSSSLKSGKTPPGTPGRKKIVRFADVLGLDLADVRTFLDDIPWVPQSAYQDLQDVDLSDAASTQAQSGGLNGVPCVKRADKCLVPMFQQPGNQVEFLDRVRERQVCLESAVVTDTIFFTITGAVRVRNLDFHKSVYVRYTLDGWKTFSDLQASYVDGSCDGFSDKFSFKLYAHTVSIGSKVEFAIRFQCKGVQYWDSNLGANYTFQCLPSMTSSVTSLPISSPVDTWTASFY